MSNDIRAPAPLGSCAKCVANGRRLPATTLVEGIGCCDNCTIGSFALPDVAAAQHKLRLG